MLTRRDILKQMMLAGGFSLLPFGRTGWALAAPGAVSSPIIVILMRGAVDGLSVVTPFGEQNYYRMRHSIALAPPGRGDGVLNLDGFFGLNPALASLAPLWQNQSLAFVHASGSPSETRSHFEAQDILETAMLNAAMARDGWLDRLVLALPNNRSATRALSFGNTIPKIAQGSANIATVPLGIHAGMGASENPRVAQEFTQLYGGNSQLNGLYRQALSARDSMSQDLQNQERQNEMVSSGRGAPSPEGFALETTKAAEMIRQDPTIQVVFMDVGGWDTHIGQGNARGQLSNKLQKFGEGLAALADALGPAYRNTTVLVMSEFGRTVAENGDAGTDHGHGNVTWLMGGRVAGGKVWGRWPGLNGSQLYQGRDLAVTTDFRSIIGTTLAGHFGFDDRTVASVIPGYARDGDLEGLVSA